MFQQGEDQLHQPFKPSIEFMFETCSATNKIKVVLSL